MGKLDELDFLILDHYQKDGKCSYSKVARLLNVSEGTIRQRTKKMRSNGVFDFMIQINPIKVGLAVKAVIGLKVNLGNHDEIGTWLASFQEIVSVTAVSGYHDFIIQAYFNHNESLVHFVNYELSKSADIYTLDVSVQLKEYKNSFSYLLSNKSDKSII
nr:Lrp/AsnC family transcriptional regulator [Shouchella xiaoxiensis]